jgi:hypothetical protein
VPYPGFEAAGADPWTGRYRRDDEIVTTAGPSEIDAWSEGLLHVSPGKILVGTIAESESVYGAGAAAVEAARRRGHAIVWIETAAAEGGAVPAGGDLARVVLWDPALEPTPFWEAFERRPPPSGVALPLIPGWTAEEEFLTGFFASALAARAMFAVPFEISADGPSRAAIHSDFARLHPDSADSFFHAIHHKDWDSGVAKARDRFRALSQSTELSSRVPTIFGRSDFEANVRVVDALEREADAADEPLASRLLAAARRLEDLGRDLTEIGREGNIRLLWPSDSFEGRVAAGVLAKASRPA